MRYTVLSGALLAALAFVGTRERAEPEPGTSTALLTSAEPVAESQVVSLPPPAVSAEEEPPDTFDETFGGALQPGPAATVKAQPVTPDLKPLPQPRQGVFKVAVDAERVAPLRIRTAAGKDSYFVKLVNAASGAPIISFFVRGGQTYEAEVPLGEARIKYASGSSWYGEEKLFGPETRFSQTDKVFDFSRTDDGVRGYTVELIKQVGGNLRTSSIDRSEF